MHIVVHQTDPKSKLLQQQQQKYKNMEYIEGEIPPPDQKL